MALGMAVQGWLVPIGARDSPQMHLSDHFSNLAKPPAKQTPARQPTQKAFITDWTPPPPEGRSGETGVRDRGCEYSLNVDLANSR